MLEWLLVFADRDGVSWVSPRQLVKLTPRSGRVVNYSLPTILRALRELRDLGWLVWDRVLPFGRFPSPQGARRGKWSPCGGRVWRLDLDTLRELGIPRGPSADARKNRGTSHAGSITSDRSGSITSDRPSDLLSFGEVNKRIPPAAALSAAPELAPPARAASRRPEKAVSETPSGLSPARAPMRNRAGSVPRETRSAVSAEPTESSRRAVAARHGAAADASRSPKRLEREGEQPSGQLERLTMAQMQADLAAVFSSDGKPRRRRP